MTGFSNLEEYGAGLSSEADLFQGSVGPDSYYDLYTQFGFALNMVS